LETTRKSNDPRLTLLEATRQALADLHIGAALNASGMDLAQRVLELTDDAELAVAAWIAHLRHRGDALDDAALTPRIGAASVTLAVELTRLGELGLPSGWTAAAGLDAEQTEALRKMLLAVAADPRLIVARIAEQLARLRQARELPPGEQQRLAVEAREIFAPLANRLGIWNLKWELEDLAFRTLEPDAYHRIATALAERRVDREQYIERICAQLRTALEQAGVAASVYGRPKHIYSIWRKMQRKHLAFEQIYDVRALRIVVETIPDCYAALGVVHGLWPFIAGEFDDYIAIPKGNQYRSIHTAVTGPAGRAVEIQIRTRDMHEHAELGVAAHWRYKEGGGHDARYDRKIEWARRLLDPAQASEGDGDFIDSVRRGLFADRIYALTPRGEIVDLPRGATPLDFAYHVHTNLGHRCRGAKVNGRIVPLTQTLANGEVVEIITGRTGGPSRDWLNPDDGFLASPRSRAKVRAWFRQQEEAAAASSDAAGAEAPPPVAAPADLPLQLPRRSTRRRGKRSAVDIEGVGDLPTTMARCCVPVPPEPIAGYVTLGRGVTIHRAGCHSLKRMRELKPDRVLQVEWNVDADSLMPLRIRVEAYDRRGLLRDVTDVLAAEKMSIEGVNSNTDPADRIATIEMRTAVHDAAQLARVLKRLKAVPNVLRAQRAD
jgi:GTP pyrophosphokinase